MIQMKKIKILGIAPYEGMGLIMQKLAEERQDLELDMFVGDLEQGAALVQQHLHKGYDAIISRGGTATLISHVTQVPVIEVTLSVYDILRAIKLAENYTDRYAIVGFANIAQNAQALCSLLRYDIDIFTIQNDQEIPELLCTLKKQGYHMILCDMITNTIAKRLGLNTILITSGNESIATAFDQAVRLSSSYLALKQKNQFLEDILQKDVSHTLVLDKHGAPAFSTLSSQDTDAILPLIQKETEILHSSGGEHKFFKNVDGTLYSFHSRLIETAQDPYAVFYFSAAPIPVAASKHGIQYSSLQESEDLFFHNFYSIPSFSGDLTRHVQRLNQTSLPIMLLGESGCGKEQAARMIYSESPLKNNPLILIHCAQITDKSWNFITNHYNSPLNDNDNTLFFKDISLLPENRAHQLLSIMIDMNLCKRNRVIFSCSHPQGTPLPEHLVNFVNQLSCMTLQLPPLRERPEQIPALASLYLNILNVTMANQIIGFEDGALKLLQEYPWPYNYTQFKRILSELALMTDSPYIQTRDARTVLEKENSFTQNSLPSAFSSALDLHKPLNEINRDIIQLVLNQAGGNQSTAARQLGISRTTLWRYLK